MLPRLIEAHYAQHPVSATREQLHFWLVESRTPQMLLDLSRREPTLASEIAAQRPLLQHAIQNDLNALRNAIIDEEHRERDADRLYWEPLKRELEQCAVLSGDSDHRSCLIEEPL
jgi:hypothetical protein